MEPQEYRSTLALELLAASLTTRLTLDELDWLGSKLVEHTQEQRREKVQREQADQGEPLALATVRDAWKHMRGTGF